MPKPSELKYFDPFLHTFVFIDGPVPDWFPYPNEHSARLVDPKQFDPKTFRRTEGGTIYGHIKVPKTISIIWGKYKKANKPSDYPVPQALRFPVTNWTESQARKWLKDNNVKYILFEPATGGKNMETQFAFRHNSTLAKSEPVWSGVDKTKLPRTAFARQGEANKKSTWGFPHHWISGGSKTDKDGIYTNGTMYLHRGGLAAAWEMANGARGGQKAEPAVLAHLNAHRKAIGMGDVGKKGTQQSFQNHAPLKACIFEDTCEVNFTEEVKPGDNQFHIVAYSGGIILNHWFWGNIAIDLQGAVFDKAKTPVLDAHAVGNRIGFTTNQKIADKIEVDGKFLSNPAAQQLKTDLKDGFPMQASVYIPPSSIEYVKDGQTTQVNGQTLKGPGAVFRQAKIKDVVMCIFGYDSNTMSTAFAERDKREIQFNVIGIKENNMGKEAETQLTAETFAAEQPELYQQIVETAKADGEQLEMDRFKAICELAPDDPAFVIEQFGADKSVEEAKTALIEKMKKQPPKKGPTPAEQEFTDEQTKQTATDKKKEGEPATFDEAVELEMSKDTSNKSPVAKRAAATRLCVTKYPKLHKDMLETNTHTG
jgi:hypothetical protein